MKFNSYIKIFTIITLSIVTLSSCTKSKYLRSSLTGWNYGDPKYGNFPGIADYKGQKTPPGMVLIEGGTFIMGHVQDDVMFDWNTTPKRIQIRSFYMDEAEVTNKEYAFYLNYLARVFPQTTDSMNINKRIYQAALPDTTVWLDKLGSTNLLAETYLRHPAFSNYPVVGVSWLQAVGYCKWRTDRVNERILMNKGVLKPIFENDTVHKPGEDNFVTDTYLKNPYLLFDGDSSFYKKGIPLLKGSKKGRGVVRKRGGNSRKSRTRNAVVSSDSITNNNSIVSNNSKRKDNNNFTGRHIIISDGILTAKFRLPTEAEWEYAAKANIQNRLYNTLKGRNKYAWEGDNPRSNRRGHRGDMMANFKQGRGDYSGLAGWSSDGATITSRIKTYKPNAFGLYNMSGNVAEWVADVYRPTIDSKYNDFDYFRGTYFTKTYIGKNGKVVVLNYNNIKMDTLQNGRIVPDGIPGQLEYTPITKDDAFMKFNYSKADNVDFNDGDLASNKYYYKDEVDPSLIPEMYNAPKSKIIVDSNGKMKKLYDTNKFRNTLISNTLRVIKGGSWKDLVYWLDPSQRRALPEYAATNYVGFRCAMDRLGSTAIDRRRGKHKRYVRRK